MKLLKMIRLLSKIFFLKGLLMDYWKKKLEVSIKLIKGLITDFCEEVTYLAYLISFDFFLVDVQEPKHKYFLVIA